MNIIGFLAVNISYKNKNKDLIYNSCNHSCQINKTSNRQILEKIRQRLSWKS